MHRNVSYYAVELLSVEYRNAVDGWEYELICWVRDLSGSLLLSSACGRTAYCFHRKTLLSPTVVATGAVPVITVAPAAAMNVTGIIKTVAKRLVLMIIITRQSIGPSPSLL